jgi:hypothetical protein
VGAASNAQSRNSGVRYASKRKVTAVESTGRKRPQKRSNALLHLHAIISRVFRIAKCNSAYHFPLISRYT